MVPRCPVELKTPAGALAMTVMAVNEFVLGLIHSQRDGALSAWSGESPFSCPFLSMFVFMSSGAAMAPLDAPLCLVVRRGRRCVWRCFVQRT